MLIIGEKINGTRSEVAQAIATRDAGAIQQLARRQTEAGSHWLDVNAGTAPDKEPDDLVWLIDTIQAVVDTPLCLDSANSEALAVAVKAVAQPPMINSVTGSPRKLEELLPLVAQSGGPVIALLLDNTGIPRTVTERVATAGRIMLATRAAGIADEDVYLDPITLTIASEVGGARITLETMRALRHAFPGARLSVGLSNISFGLPERKAINRAYLTLALDAGLDAAILDPLDDELRIAIQAAEAVIGRDKYGVKYIRSLRPESQ
jgi:5-methyltetrahydrofolate--homocysteine methyltransferase